MGKRTKASRKIERKGSAEEVGQSMTEVVTLKLATGGHV